MSSRELRASTSVPTGNTYDKYGSTNPVVRRLMASFERTLDELLDRAARGDGIESLLDVGCGEGVLTFRWAQLLRGARVVGIDLADPKLESEWTRRRAENLEFRPALAESLPFARDEFDLVCAIETLEHLEDPRLALDEMARVARRHLLVSVPREPLWRALNLARGAYVRELGNTPGHLNHFSRRGLSRLLERYGDVIELRSPTPWTAALVRVSSD